MSMQRIYFKGEVFEFPQYLCTCRRFIPRWKFLGIPNIYAADLFLGGSFGVSTLLMYSRGFYWASTILMQSMYS